MIRREYTPKEIEDLRRVLEIKFLHGTYQIQHRDGGIHSRAFFEKDKTAFVENAIRTHMMAGHTAQDLRDSERIIP